MTTQTPGQPDTTPENPPTFPPPGYGPPFEEQTYPLNQPTRKGINLKLWIPVAVLGVLVAYIIGLAIIGPSSAEPVAKAPAAAQTTKPVEQPKAAEPTKPAAVETTKPAVAAPPANQLNKPVRDGKFEFTVTGVQYGVPIEGQTPQGQFVAVTVTVKNIGKEARTMIDANQEAFAANGARYEADSLAGIYANSADQQVWVTPINPGNSVTGKLVFDIPQGVKLTKLKVHDSMLSGGATITLG